MLDKDSACRRNRGGWQVTIPRPSRPGWPSSTTGDDPGRGLALRAALAIPDPRDERIAELEKLVMEGHIRTSTILGENQHRAMEIWRESATKARLDAIMGRE